MKIINRVAKYVVSLFYREQRDSCTISDIFYGKSLDETTRDRTYLYQQGKHKSVDCIVDMYYSDVSVAARTKIAEYIDGMQQEQAYTLTAWDKKMQEKKRALQGLQEDEKQIKRRALVKSMYSNELGLYAA